MCKKKVIIIGAGFGGLSAANLLKNENFEITIIDKTNHHLFQPLLYQVATAALSPADIAVPVRTLFSANKNVKIIMEEVTDIDVENKTVKTLNNNFNFDYLIVACGARHSYFGNDDWEQFAPGLKTLTDALVIREKIINALEEAEKIDDPTEKKKFLTFAIVGGGPTGVEVAGAIAEISKKTMIKDYKTFNSSDTKIFLIEALPRLLVSFDEKLSLRAKKDLEEMGVEVLLNTMVKAISSSGVKTSSGGIDSKTVIWAAGNSASPLLKSLSSDLDKSGRVIVEKDCSIKSNSNIFVIGDAAAFKDGGNNILPGVAQVAIQQGKYVAKIISKEIEKSERKPFRYNDKGTMATIGKAKAVAEIKGFKLSGLLAWLTWSLIHVLFLIGFRNRFRVMVEWIWYYITNRHGTRLIVGK